MWTLVSMLGADEVETTASNNLEDACFAARDWDSKVSCDFIGVRDEDGTWMIWFDKCGESGTEMAYSPPFEAICDTDKHAKASNRIEVLCEAEYQNAI